MVAFPGTACNSTRGCNQRRTDCLVLATNRLLMDAEHPTVPHALLIDFVRSRNANPARVAAGRSGLWYYL